VQHLAGVFFQVSANDADLFHPRRRGDLQPAFGAEGQIVLADLIVLREIRIVVIFTIPPGEGGDRAIERHSGAQGQVEGTPVEDRQRSRQAQAHGARRRVGRQAEPGAAATEQLGFRQQLNVDFQADDDSIRQLRHGSSLRVRSGSGYGPRMTQESSTFSDREQRAWKPPAPEPDTWLYPSDAILALLEFFLRDGSPENL
jgi:hypothetical protein